MTQEERIVQLERAVLYLAKALNKTIYALDGVAVAAEYPLRAPRGNPADALPDAREALKAAVDLLSLEDVSGR